ncbi:S-layer homology domain-containing protein [Lutibacter sp. B2]|nr:S-layer homology domain-containing protein [Lutibacter sp. B2]
MKKIFIAISIAVTMILSSIGVQAVENQSYKGIKNYQSLYKNCNFYDVKNHWAGKSIYKMSILSVIRGEGNNKFYPDRNITKEEALSLLVRLGGLEGEAQKLGENQNDWSQGYIKLAQSKNIIGKEDVKNINELSEREKEKIEENIMKKIDAYAKNDNITEEELENIEKRLREDLEKDYTWRGYATREEIAIWVANLIRLEPIRGQKQQLIYTLKDYKDIKVEDVPIIESVLQKGFMKGNDKGYFNPKKTITRAEMAVVLDNISEKIFKDRGYKLESGFVENVEKYVTPEKDNVSMEIEGVGNYIITLRDEEDQYIKINSKQSSEGDTSGGFIVYKEGHIGYPSMIKENDYINCWINPKNEVIYTEID